MSEEASGQEARRRRADRLLGELLPEGDETEEGWNEPEDDTRDDQLHRDVPPHHG